MRSLLYILTAVGLMLLAFWAYGENYRTQASLKEAERLRAEIGSLRERLGVLRAEWAFLNRPERLRDLADLNYDRLGLLPLRPDQFGTIGQITYPAPELPPEAAFPPDPNDGQFP